PEEEAQIKDENLPPEADDGKWTGYETFQVELAVNAELYLTGDIVRRANDLDDLINKSDIEGAVNRASQVPPTLTQQDFRNLVNLYDQINGLNYGGDGVGELAGGLFGRYKWFGLGVYTNTYVEVAPHVDLANQAGFSDTATVNQIGDELRAQGNLSSSPTTTGGQQLQTKLLQSVPGLTAENAGAIAVLAEQSGVDLSNPDLQNALTIASQQSGLLAGGGISHNLSGATAKALSTQEVAITLGIPLSSEIGLPLDPDILGIGISPKLMHGITAEKDVRVVDVINDNESFKDVASDFWKNREESFTWGIDAGVTLQPFSFLRVGVTGRNLNNPKFKLKDGSDFELRRQVRGGIEIRPIPSIALACDADLIVNKSDALPGLKSRQIGGGIEWNPDWRDFGFAVRVGSYGDLEDQRSGFSPILTGGIGFKIFAFTFDLAGSFSYKREKFRDYEVPRDCGLAADLGLSF
ncbi:MAG TPA: conjugal transfer protein TraF, partial [Planctomycetota bacterium]|nr:conjugal transfer protein TraF [Planctomycetota bacterium]